MKIVDVQGEYYSIEETAKELKIGVATVFRWMKSGKITPIRVIGRTLIPKPEVERLKIAKP